MTRDHYKHPAYRFIRDLQTVEFPEIGIPAGGQATPTIQLPFNFIVLKLVADCRIEIAGGTTVTHLENPPLASLIRYHNSPLDNTPIPLRSAWGTARQPANLPIPWAVKQGTSIAVELTEILNADGILVPPFVTELRASLSLIGYQPSDEEFATISRYNNSKFDRVYASYTLAPTIGKGFITNGDVQLPWTTNFDMNFMACRLAGEAFDFTAGTLINTFTQAIEEPLVKVQLKTKGALLNTVGPMFRNLFGDGKFPAHLRPGLYIHQGDEFTALLSFINASPVGTQSVLMFPSLIGYVPREALGLAADLERGRMGNVSRPDPLRFGASTDRDGAR